MKVYVDGSRFLSVPCEAEERIVFDRKDGKYHLLRESAARLWEQVEGGGVFELEGLPSTEGEDDPVDLLRQAGLLEIVEGREAAIPTAPQISRRMWIGHTGKLAAATAVLPLVASLMTPRIALGMEGWLSRPDRAERQLRCQIGPAEDGNGSRLPLSRKDPSTQRDFSLGT